VFSPKQFNECIKLDIQDERHKLSEKEFLSSFYFPLFTKSFADSTGKINKKM